VIAAVVTVPLVAGLGTAGYYGYQRITPAGGVAGMTPGERAEQGPEGTAGPTAPTGVPSERAESPPGGATPGTTGGPPAEATPAASAAPSARPTAAPPVPKGWRLHADPLGFTIALPPRWVESGRQKTRVSFRLPGSPSYLQVDTTPWAETRPLDALRTVARESSARGWLPGYRLIELTAGSFMGWPAADWEFTWQMRAGTAHVVDRAFVTPDGRQFALYWHTLHDSWKAEYPRFVRFTQSFRPHPL
jgi:hypothetical protein